MKETKSLVMTRVSLITSFTDIIRALIKKMVTLITDKVLCIVCNKEEPIPKISKF